MKKSVLTLCLALLLCLTLLPLTASAEEPAFELSTPPKIKEAVLCREGGQAWVEVVIKTPSSVRSLLGMLPTFDLQDMISGIQMNLSVNGGTWTVLEMSFDGQGDKWSGRWRSDSVSGLAQGVSLEIQIRYCGHDGEGSFVCSSWSEAAVIKEDAAAEEPFEFNAHDWAKPELTEADGAGLIPADLRSADLKAPITRAEFAAVSVKVYEALSGIKAEPAAVNPFTDTKNPEVLKALNVGITNGLSDTEFGPAKLLNREQAATMLSRVYKKVAFAGWTLTTDGDYADAFRALFTMPEPFADDADISSWARDSVYFMAANGVLNGVGNNCFAPKLVTSGEETLNHATREQAILIAVRLVKNLSGS